MSDTYEPAPGYPAGATAGYAGARAGGYPAPRPPLRSVSGLGLALQILLLIHFLASAGTFAAALRERSLIHRIADDASSVSLADADRADSLIDGLGVVSLLLYIATGVVWIVWLYRARLNVSVWNPYSRLRGPGWTIGIWFIPIVNLVGPAVITKGIAEATDDRPDPDSRFAPPRRSQPAVIVWGVAFAIMAIAGVVTRAKAGAIGDADTTIDDFLSYADTLPVTTAITALAAIPAFVLVRSLTRRQTERIEQTA